MTESSIEWTDETWNPVRGCSKVSPGCINCYAERTAGRFVDGAYKGLVRVGDGSPRWTGEVRLVREKLGEPLRRKKPTRWFVNSMSDLFHEKLRDDEIARVFDVMMDEGAAHHTFQVLTKRAERMRFLVGPSKLGTSEGRAGLWDGSPTRPVAPNIWLGVSVENQAAADERIPLLLETPAAVRFLSVEPLLGYVDLSDYLDPCCECDPSYLATQGAHDEACPAGAGRLGWVIVGGESGPGARPCDISWIRSVVEQCKVASVPCFVKQLGANTVADVDTPPPNIAGALFQIKDKKGGAMHEWPADLRVREWPKVTS